MKRGTMYSWPLVTWSEISTHTTDQHGHAEAFRRRKNIKFLCARLLMTDLQIRKR